MRTQPERSPVGVFDLDTPHGVRRLFYIINEGYWTYLYLFNLGGFNPAYICAWTGGQGASFGIPRFEDKEIGLSKLISDPNLSVEYLR